MKIKALNYEGESLIQRDCDCRVGEWGRHASALNDLLGRAALQPSSTTKLFDKIFMAQGL